MPNTDDFRRALFAEIEAAARAGRPYVDINAGELHRSVGGYPGNGHTMPSCCDVLYREHDHGRADILSSPPKGKGASLTIRYHLPRQ